MSAHVPALPDPGKQPPVAHATCHPGLASARTPHNTPIQHTHTQPSYSLSSSSTAGLSGASSLLGPLQAAGASARSAARGLGVPGLDVGAGCGVLAGYYFGAGVMIKPSVVDQVARATTQLAGGQVDICVSRARVCCLVCVQHQADSCACFRGGHITQQPHLPHGMLACQQRPAIDPCECMCCWCDRLLQANSRMQWHSAFSLQPACPGVSRQLVAVAK